MLNTGILFLIYCLSVGEAFTTNSDATGKKQYQIQNGPCTYTFLLPELQNCEGPSSTFTNQVQRDDLVDYDSSVQRLEQLEAIMGNNTQWLQKVQVVQVHLVFKGNFLIFYNTFLYTIHFIFTSELGLFCYCESSFLNCLNL